MIEGHPGFAVTATGLLLIRFWGRGSSEHPADQSSDKSVRRPAAASESGGAARNPREGLPLLKTGREKVVRFLADLFSFPAGREPEGKITGPNLYESMSRRYGNRTCLPSRDSATNYENCLKCRAERCRPPPRVTPAHVYGSVFARSGPTSQEHEAVANQETRCQTTGEEWQSEAGPGGGGKGPLQSFCASFGVFFFPLLFALNLAFVPRVFINKKHFSPGFHRVYRLSVLCRFCFCVGREKVKKKKGINLTLESLKPE